MYGIYANIEAILMGSMLPYIAAPLGSVMGWELYVFTVPFKTHNMFRRRPLTWQVRRGWHGVSKLTCTDHGEDGEDGEGATHGAAREGC